jgi:nicotinamide mononucleotide transporter
MAILVEWTSKRLVACGVGVAVSGGLLGASLLRAAPLDPTEVLAFVTGGWCVWLAVEENVWNWPIGIANSVFFLVLFLQARLFAESALKALYVVLGLAGWYWWLRGGTGRTELGISRPGLLSACILAMLGVVATAVMWFVLQSIADSAPFWDALTTALSLVAQYMLTRKLLENWLVWIAADVMYVGLYSYKHLLLTAVLYGVFLTMCVAGLRQWRRSMETEMGSPLPMQGAAVHG